MKCHCVVLFFYFKQKTAYEMRISEWSSDVCSSDLMMMQQILAFDHEHAHLANPELDPSEWQFRQQFHQRVFALAHLANQQPVFAQMRWRVAQYLQRQIKAIIARTQPQ